MAPKPFVIPFPPDQRPLNRYRLQMASVALIELISVTKSYQAPDGAPALVVLRNASLAVQRGESLAVVGPSGSGKSTVLNLLGGLDRAEQGSVRFDGHELTAMPEPDLAKFRNRSVGFVFQQHHLLPHATVLENVLVPALAEGKSVADAVVERGRKLLQRVGLGGRLDYLPGRLSGGERQRAAVVRALINEPALVLADEPTGALDQASAAEVAQLLVDLNRESGVTLIVVTHNPELAARMGRRLELKSGHLVEVTL